MIEIENESVWGFEHSIRGMRNPMNSWDKRDTIYSEFHGLDDNGRKILLTYKPPEIGHNDLELMQKLYKAGTEHRKYLRQIFVSMDVTAPLYWWKEFDTYKIGTVANSCSTMHTIHKKEFELDDFSWDQLLNTGCDLFELQWGKDCSTKVQPQHFLIEYIIPVLNICREKYLETNDKKYWWQIIQLLPSSYNQKRTVTMNYENVVNIINQRTGHKLDEWNEFCSILKSLPYVNEIMVAK